MEEELTFLDVSGEPLSTALTLLFSNGGDEDGLLVWPRVEEMATFLEVSGELVSSSLLLRFSDGGDTKLPVRSPTARNREKLRSKYRFLSYCTVVSLKI